MTTCRMKFCPSGSRRYFVDDKEVDEWTYHKMAAKELAEQQKALRAKKQNGRRFKVPGLFGDFGDWSRERDQKTGMDGRYCGQLARFPKDPRAVFKSKRSMLEAAKRRGMVEDTN